MVQPVDACRRRWSSQPPVASAGLPAAERRWRTRLHRGILAVCLGAIALSALLDVRDGQRVVVPRLEWQVPETCSLQRTFGLPCPGCGMTRGFIALADGEVQTAWAYNPASLPLFLWMLLLIPYQVVQLWRIKRGRYPLTMGMWAVVPLAVLTVLMFANWIGRLWPT